jgi:hypothetical protein
MATVSKKRDSMILGKHFCFGLLTLILAGSLHGRSLLEDHDFHVLINLPEPDKVGLQTIRGDEVRNNSLNRFSLLSENQYHYPEPESGCGPTAMLNVLVWYQKYGLIRPIFRDADPEAYKLKTFRYIDDRLNQFAGRLRVEVGGSTNRDIAMVMDQIVREHSDGSIRIQTDYAKAPVDMDLIRDTNPNFRAGFLSVYPKHPRTGELMTLHAVTFVRADREGYITIGTWGQVYRGRLRMRGGHQWFIPQDPRYFEMRVHSYIRFIPFRPKEKI